MHAGGIDVKCMYTNFSGQAGRQAGGIDASANPQTLTSVTISQGPFSTFSGELSKNKNNQNVYVV